MNIPIIQKLELYFASFMYKFIPSTFSMLKFILPVYGASNEVIILVEKFSTEVPQKFVKSESLNFKPLTVHLLIGVSEKFDLKL